MPRPALPADQVRKPRIIRLSDQEWERIGRVARERGIKGASKYVRAAVVESLDRDDPATPAAPPE